MNTQLEEFINQKKAEQKKKRDEHLISLGLVDTSKTIKEKRYFSYNAEGCKVDASGQFYKETTNYTPIEITDEEYEELLKYAPIATFSTQQEKSNKPLVKEEKKDEYKKQSKKWSSWIDKIAILSFIASIISLIAGIALCSDGEESGMVLVIAGICGILYYPIIRGFSRVVEASEKQLSN